nr:MAG TPA: hypothetical protein [Caudoviricetes sp.]
MPQATSTPSGLTISDVQKMDDQQLHDFLVNVDKTDVPAFLNSVHLQKMLYALGMNDKPEIVDSATMKKLMSGPNAPEMIYRTVNGATVAGSYFSAKDMCDMLTDGDLTYVGNGVYGDGLYFSSDKSGSKAYGWGGDTRTVGAIFNSKAKMITKNQLNSLYDNFVKTHPESQKALGFAKSKSGRHSSLSQFALVMGYNVIVTPRGGSEKYYTVIDRSALTMTRDAY